ncbi:MAG TPA: LytR family transcriptional regulator, partial [Nocardioidaceae bacterium]|nr:LytR family transcriptional regulator [Nocardioidaceae bacterium]
LLSILRKVRTHESEPGYMERGLFAAVRNMDTNVPPTQLFRLAQAVTAVRPSRLHGCVVGGRPGMAGAASVVFPHFGQAKRIGNDTRRDATLNGRC